MKPMIIIPPDLMSEEDIKVIRENGICVAVASDPCQSIAQREPRRQAR